MDRRRALLTLAFGALAPSAIAAAPRRVAMMTGGVSAEAAAAGRLQMLRYLADEGLVAGRDVEVEVTNLDERSPAFAKAADDVVASRPDVIAVSGTNMARAFQARTRSIPIVFRSVGDPVAAGLVQSLARPGGNITGQANHAFELEGKRLQILAELRPQLQRVVAVMVEGTAADLSLRRLQVEARPLGIQVDALVLTRSAGEERDVGQIVSRIAAARDEAVLFSVFPSDDPRAPEILAALRTRGIPALFQDHRIVRQGGLVSLGVRLDPPDPASFRMLASIIRGRNPATTPVIQSTATHLAINLRTATAMRLAIPQAMRIRADELIE